MGKNMGVCLSMCSNVEKIDHQLCSNVEKLGLFELICSFLNLKELKFESLMKSVLKTIFNQTLSGRKFTISYGSGVV